MSERESARRQRVRELAMTPMPAPIRSRVISGGSVTVGTCLVYLNQPFRVDRLEPLDTHATLGPRWAARDASGRTVIVYEQLTATVCA